MHGGGGGGHLRIGMPILKYRAKTLNTGGVTLNAGGVHLRIGTGTEPQVEGQNPREKGEP